MSQKFCMNYGDTNFIAIVNPNTYSSFIREDWDLKTHLLPHFAKRMQEGNIIVIQPTGKGVEYSWNIDVKIGTDIDEGRFYRKAESGIKVTNNELYLVDYDCLTMAAQFNDERVPDGNCSQYRIDIKNGIYKVTVIQYYNVDENKYFSDDGKEFVIFFHETSTFNQIQSGVIWNCIY